MNITDLKEYKKKLSKLNELEKTERDIYLRKLSSGELQGPLTGYPTIDKPWLKLYDEKDLRLDISKESPYSQFLKTCEKYGDEIFYTYIVDDKLPEVNMTFNDVKKQIIKMQKALLATGCKSRDKIIAILPNTPEAKNLMWAAFNLGIIIYPISPLLSDKVLNQIISKNDFKELFIYEGFMDKYKESIDNNKDKFNKVVTFSGIESLNPVIKTLYRLKNPIKRIVKGKTITFNEFMNKAMFCKQDINSVYEYNENDTLLIEGTSGTTGIPKGVEISGRNINTTYTEHSDSFIEFEHGDNFLDIMNNSLAYGATTAIITALRGVRTFFRPGFTMDPYDDIIKYKINQVIGGPVHVKNLNKHIQNGDYIPPIKNWVSGGAPLDKTLESKVNNTFEGYEEKEDDDNIIVRQGYGATENQGVIAYEKKGSHKYGAMGVPLFKENVGIFKNNTDEELEYGVDGEICVSGPSIMNRYFNNPEETDKVLMTHSDGTKWLHMKDLGRMDKDGHLIFADRIKNIFQRNGMNVHPAKVTEFIKSINIVDDCIVTGVSHPEEQCVPVAFVKLNNNDLNLDEAIEYINMECYKNLEEPSIPFEIRFVENIPMNGGGKPDVQYLLESCDIDYNKDNQRKRILTIEKVNTFKI